MKTLRKDGEYVRMPYSTKQEISKVDTMVDRDRWYFAPKQEWKEWRKTFEKPKKSKETKSKKKDKK